MSENQTISSGTGHVADTSMSCFSVHIGELVIGLPVADTQTIFKIESITPVPLSPQYILGLTNLRGRVLTVVSLRRRLNAEGSDVMTGALAIGLQVAGEDIALVVDRVGEVIEIDREQRMPVPPHFDREQLRLTEGLYKIGDMLLPVLNSAELLAPPAVVASGAMS
jgi:purine-binding chemotaxis protein CheW